MSIKHFRDVIARLKEERTWKNTVKSRKKDPERKRAEIEEGERTQQAILRALGRLDPQHVYFDRKDFRKDLNAALRAEDVKPRGSLKKALERSLGQRHEEAAVCRKGGKPEPDPDLRDYENVPLKEDIGEYMEREVLPHVPDAWVDESETKVGYEIPFTRHFYEYEPPRPLEEIEHDIRVLEVEIQGMLQEVLA